MHPSEITRILSALGDTDNTYTLFRDNGVWMISDETGIRPLADWLGKIRMFDSVPSKELIEMDLKTTRK